MSASDTLTAELLDDIALGLDDFARACGADRDWIVRHVQAGIFGDASVQLSAWRFSSVDLNRARRLLSVERVFEADDELAALVVDLADEVRRLRTRLHVIGKDEQT